MTFHTVGYANKKGPCDIRRRLALLEGQRPSSCLSVLQEPGHEIGAYSIRVRPFHMRWAGVSR